MGQRAAAVLMQNIFAAAVAVGLLTLLWLPGCDRAASSAAPSTQPATSRQTVASLVPAATDMIIGMGAGDHLVAVSNWDADRPEIHDLPRVGDYRSTDWEKLAQIRPKVMVVQFREDKMPPGMAERAAELHIRLVNVMNNRLDDTYTTLRQLGEAIGERDKSAAAEKSLREKLDMIRHRTAKLPPVRTLITRSESNLACVGGGNYLDDLLDIAGGQNVLAGGYNSYPTIDRERLIELNPDVVIVLLPGASPQVVQQAKEFWAAQMSVSAVKNGRVHYLTDSYLLLPGLSAARVAQQFADLLHPEAKSGEGP
jgi:iron complex transport system substrate-binding protein